MRLSLRSFAPLAALLAAAVLLSGCERPPIKSVQYGYRGLGMVELYNPRILDAKAAVNVVPAALPPAEAGSPPGAKVFKNVQVLTDQTVTEHMRQMQAFATWVAPQAEGCAYCHDLADLSLDTKYTKVVARRMIQMTRDLNTNWKSHVASSGQPGAGVTCLTCHRGQPVPPRTWVVDAGPRTAKGLLGSRAGQNAPAAAVGYTSMPFDPFSTFLTRGEDIRVVSSTALPAGNPKNIMQTEASYALMMHMSDALGVNCTYCHNSQAFAAWNLSTPQRTSAWYGVRMVRQMNAVYLDPLKSILPAARLGPQGDAPKADCATCHLGSYRPLNGALQLVDYPALGGSPAAVTKVSAPAATVPAPAKKNAPRA